MADETYLVCVLVLDVAMIPVNRVDVLLLHTELGVAEGRALSACSRFSNGSCPADF